jgi:hypothetical protein
MDLASCHFSGAQIFFNMIPKLLENLRTPYVNYKRFYFETEYEPAIKISPGKVIC